MSKNPTAFKPGRSGNPCGRPAGTRNRASILADMLLDGQAEALTQQAIDLALEGDPTALRMCLDRIVPPRRDRPVQFALPPIESRPTYRKRRLRYSAPRQPAT